MESPPLYVIVFNDGSIKQMKGTYEEVLAHAREQAGRFTIYTQDEYEAQFGPLLSKSHLLDKMESAGEPIIKKGDHETSEDDEDPYKQTLIDTIQKLRDSGGEIFGQAINLAMKGERKDLNDRFEVGDEVRFYMEDLEATNDVNVQKLVTLLDRIEETLNSLRNINGLSNEDLGG
jgi:hypothetical protein